MAFIEVGHHDALAFGDRPIDTYESSVFAHRIDLVQSELVLQKVTIKSERLSSNLRKPEGGMMGHPTDVHGRKDVGIRSACSGKGDTHGV